MTMLQLMQNKVDAEGTEKEAIFDKFLCCCDNAELFGAAIAVAENKIPHLESTLEENAAEKKQLEADLEAHKAARAAAEGAIAKATTIREKDAAAFAKVSSDLKNNLAALASVIRQLSITMDMSLVDREMLASYLSGTRDSALASREIFDILKTIVGIENRELGTSQVTPFGTAHCRQLLPTQRWHRILCYQHQASHAHW